MKRFSAKSIAPFLVAVMIPVLSGITFFARAKVTPAKVQAAGKRKAPAAVAEAVRLKYNNENVQMNLGVGLWGIPLPYDMDGDGILDIIMLDNEGYLALYQGVGKGKTHKVKQPRRVFYGTDCSLYSNRDAVVDSHPGPLCLNNRIAGQSGRRKICFADWDNDGRKDLFVDGVFGAVWFRQLAPQDGKYYFKFEGRISSTRLEGHTTCPTPVDWDCNGIYDIVVGAEDGHFYYLANPYGL